jgi:hypothetical protein
MYNQLPMKGNETQCGKNVLDFFNRITNPIFEVEDQRPD